MKRNRIIFAVLWILSLVGISFFGGAVSYGFFTMLTLLPVISLAYLGCVYFFFHIYQSIESRTLTVNNTTPFSFTLSNEYFLTFAGVRVRCFSDFSAITGMEEETEYELLPKTEIKKETVLVCKYRGEYEVGIKKVEITDYFRLLRFSYRLPETMRVLVKPQLVMLDGMRSIDFNQMMLETKKNATSPDVLARSYVMGDDIRQIHWALSAKSGELMTRERIGEEKQGIGIVLDTKRYSEEPTVFLPLENKMLESVLAIAYFLAKKGVLTREYHYNGGICENRADRLQMFDPFYEVVSKISFEAGNTQKKLMEGLTEHRELFNSQAVFFVLHEMDDSIRNMIDRLTEQEVAVIIYLIGADAASTAAFAGSPRVKVIPVATEEDLREVM